MKIEVRRNLLDRAIGFVNPRAGAERLAARAQIAATSAVFGGGGGGYRGAQGDRAKRRGFGARARSANADILPGSERLRAEQRDAVMNQPIATAAINRMVTFVVGTGLMSIPAIDGEYLGLTAEQVDKWQRTIARDYDVYMTSISVHVAEKARKTAENRHF